MITSQKSLNIATHQSAINPLLTNVVHPRQYEKAEEDQQPVKTHQLQSVWKFWCFQRQQKLHDSPTATQK
jgi:hypothetical protein